MFGRKKKDDWWQQTNQEQNETAGNGAAAPAEAETAADTSPENSGKKKHRWAWLDAAGDILEVVIDFIVGLFD